MREGAMQEGAMLEGAMLEGGEEGGREGEKEKEKEVARARLKKTRTHHLEGWWEKNFSSFGRSHGPHFRWHPKTQTRTSVF